MSDEEVEAEAERIARSSGTTAREWYTHLEKQRGLTIKEWHDDVLYPGLILKRLGYGPETGKDVEELRRRAKVEISYHPAQRGE